MESTEMINRICVQVYLYGEEAILTQREIARRNLDKAEAGRQAFRLWRGEKATSLLDQLHEIETRWAASVVATDERLMNGLDKIIALLGTPPNGTCPHCGR